MNSLFYGLYHKNKDRETVMAEVERRTAQTVYKHSTAGCSEECKKRYLYSIYSQICNINRIEGIKKFFDYMII